MRVLLTNNTLTVRGGAEAFVRDLARALQRRGHRVMAYTSDPAAQPRLLENDPVPVATDLERLPLRPDVIHAQHHLDAMTALAALPGVPAIYHCHGAVWRECPPLHPRIHRYAAVTPTLAERLSVEYALAPERVRVVPNGVDLERFAVPARPPRATGPVTILCVARLIEQKGLVHLLDACRELERRGVDFVCDVVGGPEEPLYTTYHLELKRRHRRLGLARRVRFAGAQPLAEVLERMRRADLFVLPCVIAADGSRDITPNALIEAMAMGLPVVSTAIGGVPEIVEHGVSGLVVPPADASALADALEALVRDPQRSAALGAAARLRVEAKFDSAVNVRRYAELFAGVARAPRGVPARVRVELSREPGD